MSKSAGINFGIPDSEYILRVDDTGVATSCYNQDTGTEYIGGGGGGFTFEEGIWSPESDVDTADISFANPHEKPPFYFAIICIEGGSASVIGTYELSFLNIYDYIGNILSGTEGTSPYYGMTSPRRRATANSGLSGSIGVLTSEAIVATYATNEKIIAPTGGSGTPFSSQLTYKWLAIWKE